MRALSALIATGLCLIALWGCSRAGNPPVGRWEGIYDGPDVMVAIRLEITPRGEIFLSAPNAEGIENVAADEKPAMRQRLADELASGWNSVEPRPLDFDGRVFRKPGGIAPQMEWNPDSRQMTVILYLGMRSALRVPLRSVSQFSSNPW